MSCCSLIGGPRRGRQASARVASAVAVGLRARPRRPPPRRTAAIGADRVYAEVVAILRFSDLDLFALLDSDSDEARTFTTYLGYCVALAEHIQENYGDDIAPGVLAELQGRRSFVRMASRPKPGEDAAATTRSLLRADRRRLRPAGDDRAVVVLAGAVRRAAAAAADRRVMSAPDRGRRLPGAGVDWRSVERAQAARVARCRRFSRRLCTGGGARRTPLGHPTAACEAASSLVRACRPIRWQRGSAYSVRSSATADSGATCRAPRNQARSGTTRIVTLLSASGHG